MHITQLLTFSVILYIERKRDGKNGKMKWNKYASALIGTENTCIYKIIYIIYNIIDR